MAGGWLMDDWRESDRIVRVMPFMGADVNLLHGGYARVLQTKDDGRALRIQLATGVVLIVPATRTRPSSLRAARMSRHPRYNRPTYRAPDEGPGMFDPGLGK